MVIKTKAWILCGKQLITVDLKLNIELESVDIAVIFYSIKMFRQKESDTEWMPLSKRWLDVKLNASTTKA